MRVKVTIEVEEDYEDRDGKVYKRFANIFEQISFVEDRLSGSNMVRAIVAVVNRLEFQAELE